MVPGFKKYVKKNKQQTNKTVKLYKTLKKYNEGAIVQVVYKIFADML